MNKETSRKAVEVIAAIVQICNADQERCHKVSIGFSPDWGGNTLTVVKGDLHTHVGSPVPDADFESLVDSLYQCLCEGRGLSWA